MQTKDIESIVLEAIEMSNHIREDDKQIPAQIDTRLYGKEGNLDSMGLVAFLIDIEELFLEQDIQISLSDERAMSQTNSPFLTVETLITYIESILEESKK